MTRARILMFADGAIGRQLARLALAYDPTLICGIVSLPGSGASAHLAQEFSVPHVAYDAQRTKAVVEQTRSLAANIVMLVWWPVILPREFLSLGQHVTLNLHPSLLPHARGKDPNFWTIVEGVPFGVTIHHVTPQIDAGDIAFQREIAYSWEDTGESLYRKAVEAMIGLFQDSYPRIASFDIPRRPQEVTKATFHRRKELDARSLISLDESYTARALLNLLRARTFEPHDACRFVENGETYEVRVSIRRKQ